MPLRLHTHGPPKGACAPRTLKEASKLSILSSQCTVLSSQAGKGQGHTVNNHVVLGLEVPGFTTAPDTRPPPQGPRVVCLWPQHLYAKILAYKSSGDARLWGVINLLEFGALMRETPERPLPLSPWEDSART